MKSLAHSLYLKMETKRVIMYHSWLQIFEIYSFPDVTTEKATQALQDSGIKYFQWAPNGLAWFLPSPSGMTPSYCTYAIFPNDLVGKSWSHEKLLEQNSFLPRSFRFVSEIEVSEDNYGHVYRYIDVSSSQKPWPTSIRLLTFEGKKLSLKEYWQEHGPLIGIETDSNNMFSHIACPEKIPLELFKDILIKNLRQAEPSRFFRHLKNMQVLEYFMPELAANIGCKQDPRWHTEDVFDHLMRSVDAMREHSCDPYLKLAVLMHDVGKAATREEHVSSASNEPLIPEQHDHAGEH